MVILIIYINLNIFIFAYSMNYLQILIDNFIARNDLQNLIDNLHCQLLCLNLSNHYFSLKGWAD